MRHDYRIADAGACFPPAYSPAAKPSTPQMRTTMQDDQRMKYRLNDFGGALEQAIRSGVGPGFLGMVVVLSRVMYQGGRKKWRATIAEAVLVALATGTVGPLLAYAGLDRDLAYPLAVFIGYVGIDRIALAVTTKLGIK